MTAEQTVVCFDLGGVVVRICRGFAEAAVRAGVDLRETPEIDRVDHAELIRAHQRGRMAEPEYFERIAAERANVYTPAEVERVHRAWLIEDYLGAEDLVHELNARADLTTACLSNTNLTHWRMMLCEDGVFHSPALCAIQHRLASHELGEFKPDRTIYDAAHRALGSPSRVYFFDDLRDNVDAAQEFGWRAFLIDPAGDPPSQVRAALMREGVLSQPGRVPSVTADR
ncbi:MAG: HAD family hydrolase [Planctomycetota bacterium]